MPALPRISSVVAERPMTKWSAEQKSCPSRPFINNQMLSAHTALELTLLQLNQLEVPDHKTSRFTNELCTQLQDTWTSRSRRIKRHETTLVMDYSNILERINASSWSAQQEQVRKSSY
jgi:hypothetical protein